MSYGKKPKDCYRKTVVLKVKLTVKKTGGFDRNVKIIKDALDDQLALEVTGEGRKEPLIGAYEIE
jgi:hypothetical protein